MKRRGSIPVASSLILSRVNYHRSIYPFRRCLHYNYELHQCRWQPSGVLWYKLHQHSHTKCNFIELVDNLDHGCCWGLTRCFGVSYGDTYSHLYTPSTHTQISLYFFTGDIHVHWSCGNWSPENSKHNEYWLGFGNFWGAINYQV